MTYEDFIAGLAAYLDGRLKAGLDAREYAAALVHESDLSQGHIEVRGFHTANGNPLPIEFEPPEFNDDGEMVAPPRL